ncbi:TIGR02757 family protein [Aureisphaera galaxeae]|uniref:TIGR02757 family protein n=1 Tax=Aureisphaera galaxeae TaxID=1538023 RepID=UPI0023506C39|nr:TIGR02757 family protein [Aureisphaera galaxeae]MDC8003977.1 TIGR02757 family protein [Aureisphaera galaxeae]
MNRKELKEFLDEKVALYNSTSFIGTDPIQIPHLFQKKEDIEIIGFLVATIAWGNRKSIINNGHKLIELMGNAPHDFIMNHTNEDLERLSPFVHRTFNGDDLTYFVTALRHLYQNKGGLETAISSHAKEHSLQQALSLFKKDFFELPHKSRTEKHVSDPLKNSAAKRLNMYLRWMVRPNTTGVDFGLWKSLPPSLLSCPLDVHSGNVARKLGLLKRKQNDAKAVAELDANLRRLDPVDPVKYDFALFGLGVFEKF